MKLSHFEREVSKEASLYGKISKAVLRNPSIEINELVAVIWKLDSLPYNVNNGSQFTHLARSGRLTQIETIQIIRNNLHD